MKDRIFVDTSAWYSVADRGDIHFSEATGLLRELVRDRWAAVTTNHVVAETYTLLRIRLGAEAARQFLRQVKASGYLRRVFVREDWEAAAEDVLAQYQDQPFSYVDATSFVAMRRLGLSVAFAYDSHFTIAGFIVRPAIDDAK